MTDTKSPFEQAVDLFVYAPVGLAVAARDLVPTLVERGRRQVDPQVGVARMVGQLAMSQGRTQAEKVVDRAMYQARMTLQQLGILPDEGEPPRPAGTAGTGPQGRAAWAPGPGASPSGPTFASGPVPAPPAPAHTPVAPTPATPVRDEAATRALAIPDYESLSASQVVPRLSSLSPDELQAVRVYEEEHRGRKTILNKIAQIRTS